MKKFLETIEIYSAQRGLAPSTVCFRAVDDGKFYFRIKSGGRCWPETMEKIYQYMEENPPSLEEVA